MMGLAMLAPFFYTHILDIFNDLRSTYILILIVKDISFYIGLNEFYELIKIFNEQLKTRRVHIFISIDRNKTD